jgi:hypothetical protein
MKYPKVFQDLGSQPYLEESTYPATPPWLTTARHTRRLSPTRYEVDKAVKVPGLSIEIRYIIHARNYVVIYYITFLTIMYNQPINHH